MNKPKTKKCPKCNGKGEIYLPSTYPPTSRENRLATCRHCGGTGRLMNPLKPGDRARKIGGSYQADGTIVAVFTTLAGNERVVFEFCEPKGLLHIFNLTQVEKLP